MKTEKPRVSIGLPVYNGERFIQSALDTLLAQTFTDIELIISDNASTDRTEAICRACAARDRRVRYIRQAENLGAAGNFQFVLYEAVGEYFMWAAADDWWSPLFVRDLMNLLDENQDAVVAFSAMEHVDMEGSILRRIYPDSLRLGAPERGSRRGFCGLDSFEKFLLRSMRSGKVNIIYGLFRRQVLVSSEVVDRWKHIDWAADVLMCATVLRFGNIVFSPAILWKKTDHPFSEGALPRKDPPSRPCEAIRGAVTTYAKYLRYAKGIWTVQMRMQDVRPVQLHKRVFFTVLEVVRVTFGFAVQSMLAVKRRLAFAGGR